MGKWIFSKKNFTYHKKQQSKYVEAKLFILRYLPNSMPKILLTGGAGFIGSHLLDFLAESKDNQIAVIDNFYKGSIKNVNHHLKNRNVSIIKGDIRNFSTLKKIGNVDEIYHLAAQSNVMGSLKDPDYSFSSNIIGTYNVLKYAESCNAKKVLFSSSREVYGNPMHLPVDENHPLNPLNLYGSTKAAGEMLCKSFAQSKNMDIRIVRITNTYGTRDIGRVIPIFFAKAAKNQDFEIFGGNQILDFIWVRDVVEGIKIVSGSGKYKKETVNLGSGKGILINDLAKLIIKLTNSKSRIIRRFSRSFEVSSYIASSNKINLRATPISRGLMLLHRELQKSG